MIYKESDHVRLSEDESAVVFLDQSALPLKREFIETDDLKRMYDAIYLLEVRGAPCIGIFAGYCTFVRAKVLVKKFGQDKNLWLEELSKETGYLNSSRPTAVNLSYAIDRMMNKATSLTGEDVPVEEIVSSLRDEAVKIHEEDISMCLKIAEYGLSLIKDGFGILTHCNAGPLATSRYGTALGPILLGHERGMDLRVFADETRPLLQGARLTSYELDQAGVDVTLICDNMASMVMKQGKINCCFVGCDRVAANGDTANKIGTSQVAIMAKHYGIPFYVLGPVSSIDINCKSGEDIVIEERDPDEIRSKFYANPMAPASVKCYNPAFDVTDHELISAIITDRGILYPPFTESIGSIL